AFPYQSIPVAITVEGANILTRSPMIFGQGAVRCHPFLFEEMQAMQNPNQKEGLQIFDRLFIRHLGHVFHNLVRTIVFGITGARFSSVPANADGFSTRWYQRINLLSASLAVTADFALAILGGNLKRRELLSARLGDVHSQLFIACSILKYHSAHVRSRAEDAHAEYALTLALYKAQEALIDFYDNFPARFVAKILKMITVSTGRLVGKPDDNLIRELGDLIMEDNPVRQDIGQFIYLNLNPDEDNGRVESTYQLLHSLGPLWHNFLRAKSKGQIQGETLEARLQDAANKNIIEQTDIARLLEYDARRFDCILTDAFDKL